MSSLFNRDSAYAVIDLIRRELRRANVKQTIGSPLSLEDIPDVQVFRNDPSDPFLVTDIVEDYGDHLIAYSIGRGYLVPVTPIPGMSSADMKYINNDRVNTVTVSLVQDGKTTKALSIGLDYDENNLLVSTSVTEIGLS